MEVLQLLRRRLGRSVRHEHVRDFLPTLDQALTDHAYTEAVRKPGGTS